jgi:two-component system cell cycle sensor histidine kinase/response regulator CckA
MMASFQKQAQIKSLPAFSIYRKPRLKETDLNELVRTVEGLLPHCIHGNIGAKVTLSEKDLKIMADTALMQEALINIVKNAMDAMPDGGIFSLNTSRVSFENRSIPEGNNDNFGSCAFISLSDTGIGIDEKIKERIFEPFFTTKTGNGKGLGLPIAYHIIKEHGGSMKVESTPGQGTAINVYLPLAKPEIVNMIPIPLPAPYGRNLLNNVI